MKLTFIALSEVYRLAPQLHNSTAYSTVLPLHIVNRGRAKVIVLPQLKAGVL